MSEQITEYLIVGHPSEEATLPDKLISIYPRLNWSIIVGISFALVQKYNLNLGDSKDQEKLESYLFPGELQDQSVFPPWILEEVCV